jgi:hypothetical protein
MKKCRLAANDGQDRHLGQHHQRVVAGPQRRTRRHRQRQHCRRASARSGPPAGTAHAAGGRLCAATSARPEQSEGPHDQHQRHGDERQHQRRLRQPSTPKACSRPISSDARKRAADRAQAAHHHDHERLDDHRQVHLQRDRLARDLQRARQPGQEGAEREHAGEQQARSTPSASRPSRRRWWRRARSMPQRVRWNSHHSSANTSGPAASSSSVYCGTNAPAISTAPASPGARGAKRSSGPPDPQHEVLHDQHHAEGGQQLEDLRRGVDPPQHQHFDQPRRRPPHHARPAAGRRRSRTACAAARR